MHGAVSAIGLHTRPGPSGPWPQAGQPPAADRSGQQAVRVQHRLESRVHPYFIPCLPRGHQVRSIAGPYSSRAPPKHFPCQTRRATTIDLEFPQCSHRGQRQLGRKVTTSRDPGRPALEMPCPIPAANHPPPVRTVPAPSSGIGRNQRRRSSSLPGVGRSMMMTLCRKSTQRPSPSFIVPLSRTPGKHVRPPGMRLFSNLVQPGSRNRGRRRTAPVSTAPRLRHSRHRPRRACPHQHA